jgi:hypothetical protein
MEKITIFLIFLSCLSLIKGTTTTTNLTCYSCTTDSDGSGCNDPFTLKTKTIACAGTCYVSTK